MTKDLIPVWTSSSSPCWVRAGALSYLQPVYINSSYWKNTTKKHILY